MPGWDLDLSRPPARQQDAGITELGDPNFSPSLSSQGQVPGAAAQKQIIQNQRSAQNLLNKAVEQGFDVSLPEYEPIRQQAETGVKREEESTIANLVGWIDGPRQAINLFIQDMAGGQAEDGFRNPHFGDYWNAFWSGVDDPTKMEIETGLAPISGSETLELFGWAEEEGTGGRVGRGLADFGLQILTDPLTYLTFGLSGLGKKIAQTAATQLTDTASKKLVGLAAKKGSALGKTALDDALEAGGKGLTRYEKHLAENMDDILTEFWDDVAQRMGKDGKMPEDFTSAFQAWMGDLDDLGQLRFNPDKELEAALAHRIGKEVGEPLVGRDFANIHRLALDDLPKYAHGGARISIPFTKSTLQSGLVIPGTQGLGRKVVGDPIRQVTERLTDKFESLAWLGAKIRKGINHMDQKAPLLNAYRNGDIAGWQWHIATGAINSMGNNTARHTISRSLNAQWNHVSELSKNAGVDLDVVGADLLLRLEAHELDDALLNQVRTHLRPQDNKLGFEAITSNPELDDAIKGMTAYMQETMNSYHDALSVLDPSFRDRFIAGYIPHRPTKAGSEAVKALAGTGTGKGGTGNIGEDMLSMIVNALGSGGGAEQMLGANRALIERGVGRASAITFIDGGTVMIDQNSLGELTDLVQPLIRQGEVAEGAVQQRYLSVQQLNDYLAPVIRREADKHGIPLPPGWDGKVFDENPIATMIDYVDSMTDTINGWQLVNDLKASGLAFNHATALDTQGVIQRMYTNAVRAAADVEQLTPDGVIESKSILYGAADQGVIPGVPKHVHEAMEEIGFRIDSLESVEQARRLVDEVFSSHPSQWADDVTGGLEEVAVQYEGPSKFNVWDTKTDPDGTRHFGFRPEKIGGEKQPPKPKMKKRDHSVAVSVTPGAKNAKTKLKISIDPALKGAEKRTARRVALNWLERQWKEGGVFEGMLHDGGLKELIEGGMDEKTADLVSASLKERIVSMGDDTVEFLSREPAEIMRTRALYDDWERGMMEFVTARSAVTEGGLIVDPKRLELLGDDETLMRLRELKKAALTLGDRGYDKAVDVMRDVEVYTGVALHEGFVNPAHFNLGGPAIEGLQVQRDIGEWLSQTATNMGTIYTPEGVAAAKLAANETLKWWRAMATLPRPAFHIRNLIGGSWMNMNFGVRTPTMAAVRDNGIRLRNAMKNATHGEGLDEILEAVPKSQRAAWKEALDRGVLAGFSTTEFSDAATPKGLRTAWDWAKVWDVDNFALTRAGARIMESVEDFMRMSLFLEYYDEAVEGSGKFAADLVNAVHFDYSNLTPTETKLKSFIPFFVWTRRNLPLQIQQAVENPRHVQRYRAMMQAMDDNLNGDTSGLPEAQHFSAYAAGTGYRVNKETPFWARLMIDPDLPINDLLEIPDPNPGDMIEYANNILGPHISLISDINFQRNMGDVNAPAPFNAVLQSLAAVGMYDRTSDGDVRIPYYLRTLMETVVPFSREIADPLTGGPTDPNRQQRVGIHPDDSFLMRGAKTAGAQIMGGLGLKFTTPADARSAAFASDEEIDKLLKELRLQGEAPPVGSP